MPDPFSFQESHNTKLLKPSGEGREWDVVLIEVGTSQNRHHYSEDVLREAIPLFEGCRACAYRFGDPLRGDKFDHLSDQARLERPSGCAQNVVGWFENVRFGKFARLDGSTGEGLLAKFHILEGHDWLSKNLMDAWNHGKADLLGFSIDAEGLAQKESIDGVVVKRVQKIQSVTSTDVVTEPAAGGGFLRLVASFQGDETVDDLIALVREHRPQWFEGFSNPEEGTDLQDYSIRVLENAHLRAQEVHDELSLDEVQHLAEVARGVKTLNSVIEILRAGKVSEAMRLLRNWIAVYPVPERGDAASQRRGFYSFPYSTQQAGYPGAGNIQPYGATAPASARQKESKEPTMPEPDATPTPAPADERLKEIADREQRLQEEKDAHAKREQELRVREAKIEIEQKLLGSDLPDPAKERVRETLVSQAEKGEVTTENIEAEIKKEADYIALFAENQPAPAADPVPAAAPAPAPAPAPAAAAPAAPANDGKPTGLGDAHAQPSDAKVVQEQYDKVRAGWDGFFNQDTSINEGIPAFTSLHDAFGKITGRYYGKEDMADLIFESIRVAMPKTANRTMEAHLDRIRETWGTMPKTDRFREAVVTSDFSVAFGDSLFRRLQKVYREDPRNDWRKIISSIENLTDATNTFNLVRIGAVGTLPVVNQNAPYTEFTDPTEVNETLTPSKRGALLKFTWEDALADRIGVLRRIPTMLARSTVRTIHELVWDQIDTNPTMADSVALINATHNNLVTASPALSYTNVTAAIQLLRDQTEQDSGKKLGLSPAFLLVGPTKENEAVEITDSSVKVSATEDATVRSFVNKMGVQTFTTLGLGRSTSPDTQFRWYVAASPQDAETIVVGFLGGRDRPDIFVQSPTETPTAGAAFDADAMTFKVRLVVGVRAADHRWIAGSLATS